MYLRGSADSGLLLLPDEKLEIPSKIAVWRLREEEGRINYSPLILSVSL